MQTACFTQISLSEFLAGTLSVKDADEVVRHLEECSVCEQLLEKIEHDGGRSDSFLAAFQQAGAEIPFAAEEESQKAVDRIKSLQKTDASQAGHETLAIPAFPVTTPPERLRDYELQVPLGDGGMGMVYRARHARLDKIVAIKLIRPERVASAAARDRFDREMRAAGQLEHPNIVRAMDAGEEDGQHYLAMEFVKGETLRKIVQTAGPLTVDDACDLIEQAASGLQHIHEAGLVHRDIKPSNLMRCSATVANDSENPRHEVGSNEVTSRSRLKILDLGLALLTEPGMADGDLTSHDQVMGTYDYIAPEQAKRSHSVDIRADIYSLGCTFYFLLTGRPPFPDTSIPQKLMAHQSEAPAAVSDFRKDVSPDVESVMSRMMAKSPDDRFATPADIVAALQTAGAGSTAVRFPAAKRLNARQTPSQRQSLVRRFTAAISSLLAVALVAMAVHQVTIKTPEGEVIVDLASDVDPGDLRIEFIGNGQIHIADADNNWKINIREGTYRARLLGDVDELEFQPNRIRVLRNETERVSVTLRAHPPKPFVAEFVPAERQVADWVTSVGGKVACYGNEDELISKADELPPEPLELHTIDLTGTTWSDEDLQQLQTLPNLDRLFLGTIRTPVSGAAQPTCVELTSGAAEIVASLQTLRVLHCRDLALSDELLSQFASMPGLRLLTVSGSRDVSTNKLDQLRETLPDCEILCDVDDSLSDRAITEATEELPLIENDRRLARWVLSLRGDICINSNEDVDLTELSQLPKESFRLTTIDLRSCRVSTVQLSRLDGLKNLWRLYLGAVWGNTVLDSTTIDVLAECDLPKLGKLYIYRVPLNDKSLKQLNRLSHIFELALDGTSITDDGLKSIAELPNLRNLLIDRTKVTGSGLAHFVNHNLEVLFLVETPLDEAAILAMPVWSNLRKLRVDGTPLTDRAIQSFARYPTLQDLGLNLLTNTTNKAWSVFEHLPELTSVRFRVNPNSVDDSLFPHLLSCTKLKRLDVEICSVTDEGLKQLEGMSLRYLDLRSCPRLTRDGVNDLRKLLPDCRIVSDFDPISYVPLSPTAH